MLLSSSAYFVFLAAIFFAFWLAARSRIAGLAVILFANYFFYAKWDLAYLALIPLASTADFLIGRALESFDRDGIRRLLVGFSIAINIGLIAALKYVPSSWFLPLGVSFYAFQSLTYTIDIYRRDATACSSYLVYLCSASFFPTTLAGPITRLSSLTSQIGKRRALLPADGATALFRIGLGLMKKLLIADYLAQHLIDRVFDTPNLYSGGEVLIAVYAYAFQLYYDFSGYTDIAIGSAQLLGIKLPANFHRPYIAENIADFWRRWHITLSNWLRDYLYFSLPGLRSRWKIFTYANLVITMVLGGLWHGPAATFVIWGLIHGVGLAGFRWLQVLRKNQRPTPHPALRLLCIAVTFNFVCLAWIFFRAQNVPTALDILARIASFTLTFSNVSPSFLFILSIAVLAHYTPERWYQLSLDLYIRTPYYVQGAALAVLAVAIQYVAATGAAPFIYTRF
jgi:D-alanyl-lipoteichoic acid acyltransferase DltB (MBOAT superfamily)